MSAGTPATRTTTPQPVVPVPVHGAPRPGAPTPPLPAGGASDDISIRVRGLSVTYPGNIRALCDINLDVARGKHVAILGESGSGKTTLLGCLTRRVTPTAGTVQAHERISTIHQDLRLVKQRTALQNVLHGSLGRVGFWRSVVRFPAEERNRAIKLLNRVGLGHRIHTTLARLSGGEQQRVAIARALMQDPQIILADEPVAALDNTNAEAVMRLLRDLSRERSITLVSVLHDCALAENFADRIVGLSGGRMVYDSASGEPRTFQQCQACQIISRVQPDDAKPLVAEAAGWHKTLRFAVLALIVVMAYAWAVRGLDMDAQQFDGAGAGLWRFVNDLVPKSHADFVGIPWKTLLGSLVETLQMSLVGTSLGVLISWPLAALAARNVGPRGVCSVMRFVLNTIRTVPSLIWALFFVAAVGFGTFAGVLALVAYSIGYLTKFFYEGFESVDPGPPDALGEIGAGGLQRFLHAVWPAARPGVLSSSLFMLEYNVRAASVLGVVGAGGIGYYMKEFLDWRNFPAATACLVLLLVVVLILDSISTRVRARLVRP